MKKFILPFTLFVIVGMLVFNACESEDNPITPTTKIGYYIKATAFGYTGSTFSAQIWINGINTGKSTPALFDTLKKGSTYSFVLVAADYDTVRFSKTVANSQVDTLWEEFFPTVVTFPVVRIWETSGTTASQPSGLDLSTATAYGISSTDKDKVDVYYWSNGFKLISANNNAGLTRQTYFKVGTGTNLTDGIAATAYSATGGWTNFVLDTETKYVFLYDADHRYSKILYTVGGGVGSVPAYLDVRVRFNKALDNTYF